MQKTTVKEKKGSRRQTNLHCKRKPPLSMCNTAKSCPFYYQKQNFYKNTTQRIRITTTTKTTATANKKPEIFSHWVIQMEPGEQNKKNCRKTHKNF